jgi:hypothetical protein
VTQPLLCCPAQTAAAQEWNGLNTVYGVLLTTVCLLWGIGKELAAVLLAVRGGAADSSSTDVQGFVCNVLDRRVLLGTACSLLTWILATLFAPLECFISHVGFMFSDCESTGVLSGLGRGGFWGTLCFNTCRVYFMQS